MLQIDARGTRVNLAGPIFLTRTIQIIGLGGLIFSENFGPGPNLSPDQNFRTGPFYVGTEFEEI